MSTVDPRQARIAKQSSNGAVLAGVAVLLGIVHVGLWTLAGYGFGQLYDTFRLMSINQVGEGWDSPYLGAPWQFFVGVFCGAFLGFAVTSVAGRFLGLASAMLLPLCTGAAGIALGLALFLPSWTPEQSYGEKAGFMDGDAALAWDAAAWINYWLPVWLPVAFAVIAVILLLAVVITAFRRRGKQARIATMMQTGRRVTGTISEVRPTGTKINGSPYVEFTIRFADHLGTERWVTKKGVFPSTQLPREGDPALVWFDIADPSDQKSIVVGVGPDAMNQAS